MNFNKEEHIAKMQPWVEKLAKNLAKQKVVFHPHDIDDEKLKNVTFVSEGKTIKISQHSFYRFSGICCVSRDLGENKSEYVTVTDSMFMENFMEPIVRTQLG